jgi:hypothetical protein
MFPYKDTKKVSLNGNNILIYFEIIAIGGNGSRIKVVARSLIKCTELNANPPSRTKTFLINFCV